MKLISKVMLYIAMLHIGAIVLLANGDLILYKMPPKDYEGMIYTPNRIIIYDDFKTAILNTVQNDADKIMFTKNNLDNINTDVSNNIKVKYNKVDPTHWNVEVNNASKSFFLVFSESFNQNWNLIPENKEVSIDKHFMVNGFSNAWHVNSTLNNISFKIQFIEQKNYLLYLSLSAIIFVSMLVILFFLRKY
jgi:hypothetical protein